MYNEISSLSGPSNAKWFGRQYASKLKDDKPTVTVQVRTGRGAVETHRGSLHDFVVKTGTFILNKGADAAAVPCRAADVVQMTFH